MQTTLPDVHLVTVLSQAPRFALFVAENGQHRWQEKEICFQISLHMV